MEQGSLRCDANISLRAAGSSELGVKTELKNMNSFRFIERGIRAEIARQREDHHGGGEVVQETLHYEPGSGAITSLRSKEEAHDYRYFPEPDLLPVTIDEAMVAAARAAMSSSPLTAPSASRRARPQRRQRQGARLPAGLGDSSRRLVAAALDAPAQALANWVTVELRSPGGRPRPCQGTGEPGRSPSSRDGRGKRVSVGAARQVLDRLVAEGGDPEAVVEAEGLAAIGGGDELAGIVAAALEANADAAERVRQGNAKAIGPIVGQVMRETKGRADGTEVSRLINSSSASLRTRPPARFWTVGQRQRGQSAPIC